MGFDPGKVELAKKWVAMCSNLEGKGSSRWEEDGVLVEVAMGDLGLEKKVHAEAHYWRVREPMARWASKRMFFQI